MMPLNLADAGSENIIKKIGGSPEVKKHLENLGFVVGGTVTVIATVAGNHGLKMTARSHPVQKVISYKEEIDNENAQRCEDR